MVLLTKDQSRLQFAVDFQKIAYCSLSFVFWLVLLIGNLGTCWGQSYSASQLTADSQRQMFEQTDQASLLLNSFEGIDQLLTRLALAHLPSQFTDDKNWGMQEEKTRTVRLLNEQGRLDPHTKKKLVNHGNWRRYTASLRNPEEEFQVRLKNVRELPTGKIGFQIFLKGHLDFVAQQANWKRGIRLLGLTATGHTEVEVELDLELVVEFVGKGLFPDIVLRPQATNARLTLTDFRIDRIGKIGGEIAQQVSREAKHRISDKLPEQEKKIVDKVNQEFSKKEDGYRFSLSDSQESKFKDVIAKLLESQKQEKR